MRAWTFGCFLLGILLGCLGSLLIVWQYHIDTNPSLIGFHFLAFYGGFALALANLQRRPLRFSLAAGSCFLASFSLLSLSFLAPPVFAIWRLITLSLLGVAAGGLTASLLVLLPTGFPQVTTIAIYKGSRSFGLGCTLATAVVAITYFAGSVQTETTLLSVFPFLLAVLLATNRLPAVRQPLSFPTQQEGRFTGVGSFDLLIFFQSGIEFAVAGWLPISLVHQLGANPVFAMVTLAAYFLTLTTGRTAVSSLLQHMSRRQLLAAGTSIAITGCSLLSLTQSLAGVFVAVGLIGFGFAPIFPWLALTTGDRFSHQAGFYHRALLIATLGMVGAPWLAGYIYSFLGIRFLILVLVFSSITVLFLAWRITAEAPPAETESPEKPHVLTAAAGKH